MEDIILNLILYQQQSIMDKNYKQSNLLKQFKGIKHGFFSKNGGISTGIYDSLNCAPSSDDKLENVIENRWRSLIMLGLEKTTLYGLQQIHSTKVFTITNKTKEDFPQGDGMVTNQPGISLSVLGADCAPVLFADENAGVIGAAHAGWKGAVTGMVEAMVEKMCDLGAERKNIQACIGPTIHQDSYEVRQDFIKELNHFSAFNTEQFLQEREGHFYFNLPAYLLEQCKRSDIRAESLGLDTYVLADEFFSYRRNTHQGIKEYGRQISVIGLI